MKKTLLIIIVVLISNFVVGQNVQKKDSHKQTDVIESFSASDQNPLVLIVVDSTRYKVADFSSYNLKSEWFESVDVLKDKISKQIYGKNGVMIMYTKEEFSKEVLKEIKKGEEKDLR